MRFRSSARLDRIVGWRSFCEPRRPKDEVVLFAIVYAKIVEEHPAVADLELVDRTVRRPDERRPDPRPGRERFFAKKLAAGCSRSSNSARHLRSSSPCS
jgi:hypothetical protein